MLNLVCKLLFRPCLERDLNAVQHRYYINDCKPCVNLNCYSGSISVHSTAKDHFILQKPKTTFSLPTNDFLLYNGPLSIKEAKLKDVRDLASKYVPPEYLWYYSNLRSDENEDNEFIGDVLLLPPGLQFNSTTNEIDGFVDSGDNKSQLLADHALVFMVRGIKKKFKQPISYTFCQGATKQHDLVRQLKEVICQVQATGLCVVATICDQRCANEGAINILKNETKSYYVKHQKDYRDDIYEIEVKSDDGVERIPIVHLFDVPHLLKCTRNNLMTKDLCFSSDRVKLTAKWDHLRQLYNLDSLIADCKMLPRLRGRHSRKKSTVKHAFVLPIVLKPR
ncbi:uncharacterized protein LOC112594902 [Melanaphis sacchari]|uniref:uncharacterized protein LOC112594902 n=1 Tax=Melanaphis sacchari TaxID=742174 RepID=UPI000DC151A8|nr:uncharacterized protein LOC112594902 [Melanaphis sacchari]